MKWFYAQNGKKYGPISWTELKSLVSSGSLKTSDLAWSHEEGMSEWVPLEKILKDHGVAVEPPHESDASSYVMPEPTGRSIPGRDSGDMPRLEDIPVVSTQLATRSLLAVIIALLFCPMIYFSLFLCFVGLVLGHLSLSRIRAKPAQYRGKGRSLTALFLGYMYLLFVVMILGFFYPKLANEVRAMGQAKTPTEQVATQAAFARKFADLMVQYAPEKDREKLRTQIEEQIQRQLRESQGAEPVPNGLPNLDENRK